MVFSLGVIITLLLLNKLWSAASTPLFSFPAIGCAGTKFTGIWPKTSLAIFITLPLVLPTSVIITELSICDLIEFNTCLKLSTGVATTTICTSLSAVLISVV